ncbi:MAG: NADH-quinone oxidoreductase subunit A [Bacteroidetes bacterium]|nr:NADH-quinone oxidoreductase subunit A [Bacteroidota bacterium]
MSKGLPIDYIPLIIQFFVALAFVGVTIFATHVLGPRLKSKRKEDPFECGIESRGDARFPLSVRYFLIAILFVLFDVEVIFMYPWAVNFKKLGWFGFTEMLLFVALLMAGFFYILKKGVLNWDED